MANSVQTLPVPETLPPTWRLPALARVMARFARRKPLGAIGGVIVLALLVMAVFVDRIAPYCYDQSIPAARNRPMDYRERAGLRQCWLSAGMRTIVRTGGPRGTREPRAPGC